MGKILNDMDKIASRINRIKALVMIGRYSFISKTLTVKAYKFTGYRTVLLMKCEDNQAFDVDINVNEGEAAIYAVDKNKTLKLLCEGNYSGKVHTNIKKGFYRVRVVGDNSAFDAKITKI